MQKFSQVLMKKRLDEALEKRGENLDYRRVLPFGGLAYQDYRKRATLPAHKQAKKKPASK